MAIDRVTYAVNQLGAYVALGVHEVEVYDPAAPIPEIKEINGHNNNNRHEVTHKKKTETTFSGESPSSHTTRKGGIDFYV